MGIERSDRNQEIVNKLDRVFRLMTLDQDFNKLPEFREISLNKIKQILHKGVVHLSHNIPLLKDALEQNLEPLIESVVSNPAEYLAKFLPGALDQDVSLDDMPKTILKYIDKEYVVSDVEFHHFKYGTVGEYRHGDGGDKKECSAEGIAEIENNLDQMDKIESRVLSGYLKEERIDLNSLIGKVDNMIQADCFIGSYTENVDPEYMWSRYAHKDGACIELETTGLNLYRVIYKNYLEQYRVINDEYHRLMLQLTEKDFESLSQQIKEFFERVITLSLLCFYRKDESGDYPKEGEWREIIIRNKKLKIERTKDDKWDYIYVNPKGRFLSITSRMPESFNRELESKRDTWTRIIKN